MKKNLEKNRSKSEEKEESPKPIKKQPNITKEDATEKGDSIMKKALNKAISKGGEVPKT